MGDGSEPRHDGEQLAAAGVMVITANYRLGVFGFLAHSELRGESGAKGSGNYGLLDQVAVLQWVRDNVRAFGGDPGRVTIGGPSAGSESVHALLASPLATSLVAGAIGSSGALFPPAPQPVSLAEAERFGRAFASVQPLASIAQLRALAADDLLARSVDFQRQQVSRFPIAIDGVFLRMSPADAFVAGKQARVPLLLGSNSYEQDERAVLLRDEPTEANYRRALERLYGSRAEDAFRAYPAKEAQDVVRAAAAMGTDRFMGYPMWKWAEVHARTSKQPVYRYLYEHRRPARRDAAADSRPRPGAQHGDEIEYAFGTLDTNPAHVWADDDRTVSQLLLEAYASFVKTGHPRSPVQWPAYRPPTWPVQYVGIRTHAEPDRYRARYLFLDSVFAGKAQAVERLLRSR